MSYIQILPPHAPVCLSVSLTSCMTPHHPHRLHPPLLPWHEWTSSLSTQEQSTTPPSSSPPNHVRPHPFNYLNWLDVGSELMERERARMLLACCVHCLCCVYVPSHSVMLLHTDGWIDVSSSACEYLITHYLAHVSVNLLFISSFCCFLFQLKLWVLFSRGTECAFRAVCHTVKKPKTITVCHATASEMTSLNSSVVRSSIMC